MGKLWAVATAFALVACQPMYGAKAPKLKNPPVVAESKRKLPPQPDLPKPQPIEECEWHAQPPPAKAPKRDTRASQDNVVKADAKIIASDKATDIKPKGDLLIDSINEYGNALIKDPYNAEATLKLAVAYDKALRKGCALKMLDRLAKLAAHPTYEKAANVQIDGVADHKTWFGDYRKDALRVLGR
jgi:hypothetical protein